ncbi:transposase [Streptomyces mirabilis]|uniref:transposase n=1 Tax=Streptomyces mirabilis TaxID=68239 RepID=UPI00340FA2FF
MPGRQPAAARSFEHRRGYGCLYAALNHGRLDVERLRDLLVSLPLPRFEGRIVLSVDVSPWLRSDAACSPERLSATFTAGLGRPLRSSRAGRTPWTPPCPRAHRRGPGRGPPGEDDATAVTAIQLRAVVERLIHAAQWRTGDQEMLVVMDAGYGVTRLAWHDDSPPRPSPQVDDFSASAPAAPPRDPLPGRGRGSQASRQSPYRRPYRSPYQIPYRQAQRAARCLYRSDPLTRPDHAPRQPSSLSSVLPASWDVSDVGWGTQTGGGSGARVRGRACCLLRVGRRPSALAPDRGRRTGGAGSGGDGCQGDVPGSADCSRS